jgi:hypothetical protein
MNFESREAQPIYWLQRSKVQESKNAIGRIVATKRQAQSTLIAVRCSKFQQITCQYHRIAQDSKS